MFFAPRGVYSHASEQGRPPSDEADDEGWEAAAVDGEAAGNALSDAELVAHLRAQLQRGQAVMRALVMECLAEREAKQELEFQLTQLRARVE